MTAGTDTENTEQGSEHRQTRPRSLIVALDRVWRTVTFGGFSSLTRRIVFLNLVALIVLVVAILILNQSRSSLIDAEVKSLTAQGELIANSIAASATDGLRSNPIRVDPEALLDLDAAADFLGLDFPINPVRAGTLVTYLSSSAGPRVRVYDTEGTRLVDSDSREIRRRDLPPLGEEQPSLLERIWNGVTAWFRRDDLPIYQELGQNEGAGYEEVVAALAGEHATLTRVTQTGELIVSVAMPIRGYQTIQGAVLLTTRAGDIDNIIREERNAILRVFAVAAAVSVMLSFLLAGTIAAPLRRLAAAAERVGKGLQSRPQIPDFSKRGDEIGDLSLALRDMTASLYNRIDAIESFAADVAHELKNPLTSLRSAVETLPLAKTLESRARLTDVIQHDVRRLDRLISEIADASRLDAELYRRDVEPVDIAKLLQTLVSLANETADEDAPAIKLEITEADLETCRVIGHDVRISQVFSNLIDNARSFSPPRGEVRIKARRAGDEVEILVEDEGPGINAEQFERIFERFYTDRPDKDSFGQNSGLGLSISRQIVEAHNGRIWAENIAAPAAKAGKAEIAGARFIVRLPAVAH